MKTRYEYSNKTTRKIILLLGVFLGTGLYLLGCGGGRGDTANSGDPNAGPGSPFVASQGGGSTILLELEGRGNEIQVTQQRGFRVTLTDPHGNPISGVRVFCESEKGISIIEPSSGGVAFAHTNRNGIMSGVIGGLLPGSYMLECRGPHGFDLFARTHIRVTGSVPEGFAGFPGAAGGNLGGGTVVAPPPGENVTISQILFTTVASTTPVRTVSIDISQGVCTSGGNTVPERFGPDNFVMRIANTMQQRVFVDSVTIEGPNGSGGTVATEQQLGGFVIAANSNGEFTGPFTDVSGSNKVYAGTSVSVPSGTHNIRFTLVVRAASGDTMTLEGFATIRAFDVNNCT